MSRVAIFAPKFPPDAGGAAVYFQQVVDVLADSPYEPVVFAPARADWPYRVETDSTTVYRVFPQLGSRVYAGAKYIPRVHRLLKELQPVLAHVHPHFPQYRFFRWLLQYHAIPRVYDCRDHEFTRWYVRDGRSFLSATAAIDTILEDEAGVDPNRIHRSPVVMPDADLAECILGDGTHVAFVGDVAEHKGADIAADAVARLRRTGDVTLHIAGDGPLADELAGRTGVIHHGCVQHAAALGLVAAADAVVLPSASEGRPRVAIEAMHLGTPVVGTNVGELPDVVGDAGKIVPRDAGRVADGVRTVVAGEEYANRAAERDVCGSVEAVREGVLAAYRQALPP